MIVTSDNTAFPMRVAAEESKLLTASSLSWSEMLSDCALEAMKITHSVACSMVELKGIAHSKIELKCDDCSQR